MNAPERITLEDVQAYTDKRDIPIQFVGVRDVRYPLTIQSVSGESQSTIAMIEMTVGLPGHMKGTHMSRFLEFIEFEAGVELAATEDFLDRMLARLEATAGRIIIRFVYFLSKKAPVSGISSLLDVDVELTLERSESSVFSQSLKITVPVTSLCPCSKQISAYGAHNQRSNLVVAVTALEAFDIDSLVRLAEEEASCQIFGLLKREDEKWVTEKAYDNPKFVEDLVRDIALRLRDHPDFTRWSVDSENFESIHNHSAYARIEGINTR
ncbi:MAG: GTP cyclohydrolase I FolE2 [Gammaproteobacteria bacterium HGW-Gammaproteobacteria-11]|nr:MAG: GTP cyclohydrolase I FolE2 [Gammaproteobacteria bacterium HGW-Gammaproteobacteria-11]